MLDYLFGYEGSVCYSENSLALAVLHGLQALTNDIEILGIGQLKVAIRMLDAIFAMVNGPYPSGQQHMLDHGLAATCNVLLSKHNSTYDGRLIQRRRTENGTLFYETRLYIHLYI